MSLLFVKEYIKDTIIGDVRQGLKLIERIAFNIWTDAGLSLWYRYGIEINSAIPTGVEIDTVEPKWNTFLTIRLPQIERETIKKREKYLDIQRSIEARIAGGADLGVDGD
jgi:hypothetical protein